MSSAFLHAASGYAAGRIGTCATAGFVAGCWLPPSADQPLAIPGCQSLEEPGLLIQLRARSIEHLAALRPTCVIVIGAQPGPHREPVLIGVGDLPKPPAGTARPTSSLEALLPAHPGLAGHIALRGYDAGIEWRAYNAPISELLSPRLLQRFFCLLALRAGGRLPCIPILLNSAAEPAVSLAEATAIGRQLGAAVRSYRGNERVLVIACATLGHWHDALDSRAIGTLGFDAQIRAMVKALGPEG